MFTIKIDKIKRDLSVIVSLDSQLLKKISKSPLDFLGNLFSKENLTSNVEQNETGESVDDPSPTLPDDAEEETQSEGGNGESQGEPSPTLPDED